MNFHEFPGFRPFSHFSELSAPRVALTGLTGTVLNSENGNISWFQTSQNVTDKRGPKSVKVVTSSHRSGFCQKLFGPVDP